MMKNGGAETGKDARTRQSNARNSSETSRKRNAEFDFDGLVRSYLDKDGFANRESERKLIAALEADPSGNALLNTEKGEAGKKQKIVGSLKKEFEKQLGKLTDVPGGVIAVRKILVREILARKREIVAKETANAARKSSLAKILKAEYVLSADEIRRTDAHLEKAKPEDVANALRNGEKREDFIWNALGRPNKMPEISSRMEHISKIGVKKAGESDGPEVTERAKKIALWQKAILSGRLTDEQAADIIREFQNPEDRKILVRTLIPNSDLGTLVEKGFVSAEEARKTVRKATEDLIAAKKGSDATFSSLSPEDVAKIVASVNLKDVPVPVDDLPDAVLKGFVSEVALTGRLAERLREEVNRGMRDAYEDVEGNFRIEADVEGKFAKDFAKETAKRLTPTANVNRGGEILGIENLAMLADETSIENGNPVYVEGDCQTVNGNKRTVIKIGPWNEYSSGEKSINVTFQSETYEDAVGSTVALEYADFYRFLSRFRSGKAFDETEYGNRRIRRRMELGIATMEEMSFESAGDLEGHIDGQDEEGQGLRLRPGLTLAIGKPSDRNFNVASVISIDEIRKTVTVRNTLGTLEELPFKTFYLLFSEGIGGTKARRLHASISTLAGVIEAEKSGPRSGDYQDLSIKTENGKSRIISKKRQFDEDYEGIRFFVGNEGWGVEIDGIDAEGNIRMREFRNFEFPTGEKPGKSEPLGDFQVRSAETLYLLLEKHGCHPYDVPEESEIKELEDVPFEKNSFLKSFLHNPNFNDILKGIGRIPDVVKHRLEHSSKHHSAHVAHAVAHMLPFFPEEWMVDFERELFAEDKKMLEEDIEHLAGLNPPRKRQKQIRTWLMDGASTHNEIIASICVMLEKHGNLYAGEMKEFEGKWLYYSRLPGNKREKEAFRASLEKKYEGREVTEEFAIHEWLKVNYEKLHLNPAYWKMVKDRWEKGASGEKENGKKEVQNWPTFGRRLEYAYGKLVNDQEYSHAIGAMEEVWNKPGSLQDRMKLPFLLAFTNIRDGVHTTILQEFTKMYDAGHTYPPLLFAQDPERQKLFRNVIRKLARTGGYEDEFNAVAGMFGGGTNNELIIKASEFWQKRGEDLTAKLMMGASDPYVLTHMEEDSELREYYSIVSEELNNSKLHDAELDIGLYTADSANWALMNPTRYSNLIEFQSWPGKLKPGGLTEFLFKECLKTFEMIREKKYSADPNEDRKMKKVLFRRIHFDLMKVIKRDVSSDWWKIDPETGMRKVYSQDWMQRLSRLGLRVPPSQDDANFEGSTYESWLEDDFNRFLGEEKTATVVHDHFAKNITDIIGSVPPPRNQTDGSGSGANGNATRERTADIMEEGGEAEEPEVSADARTPQEELTPSSAEDAATLARADEEFEGAEIRARIQDGIEHAAAILTKLDIPVDAELRAGNWLKRPIARLFEAATEAMVENVGFQMDDLVSVKIGQEIHAHYRARLAEGLERAEFLSRISGDDSDSVGQTLERPTSASREEYLRIGRLYEVSVR